MASRSPPALLVEVCDAGYLPHTKPAQLTPHPETTAVAATALTKTPRKETSIHTLYATRCPCNPKPSHFLTKYELQISEDVRPSDIKSEKQGISVTCESSESPAAHEDRLTTRTGEQDGHRSFYPWQFIKHYLQNDHRSPEQVK
ncbi:trimethyllysine dioxygenase [Colletotrichum tofieldiae]|nr:trimethyllysine dioxygenase [Colletotrichum tofieldiae]